MAVQHGKQNKVKTNNKKGEECLKRREESKCKGPEVSRKGKFLGHEASEAGLREQDQREVLLERWP